MPRRKEIKIENACTYVDLSAFSRALVTHLITQNSIYSRTVRLFRVKAEVQLTSMPTLVCCFPYCCPPLDPFIYFKSRERRLVHEYSLFLLRRPVSLLYHCCCCCVKTVIATKCSFVCGLQGLMDCNTEWPCTPVYALRGLEGHKHNVVRPTPLSLSSHCQHHRITSQGPVGKVSPACMRLTIFPCCLCRGLEGVLL